MLEKLKQYKELVAIIVFFIGGFIWMEAQFPKKSDLQNEIASLDCMLEKYMTLTQLQIQGQDLQNQIQNFNRQVKKGMGSNLCLTLDGKSEWEK